ncbi:MAG: hypothetical protein KF886_22240 [Candidatus Hydrogenedentes bacterium]|nr:hypothetical protein [Candidatus Hydrogenedentota bacterium]
MSSKTTIKRAGYLAATGLLPALLLAGCPAGGGPIIDDPKLEYNAGFVVGFAEDGEYWQGFDDSYDTRDGGEIYYTGDLIPQLDEVTFEAGYYDGVWYAYNDGYFVAYDYAFTIGFSEGYDVAFGPNWRAFLLADAHVEWLDGGFSDGYNDGFSEGRILGASDWLDGLPFDWLDALLWYQGTDEFGNLNDIYFEDLDLGTGVYGPVYLYEYGTNPFDLIKGLKTARQARPGRTDLPAIRAKAGAKQEGGLPELSYRPLTQDVQSNLKVRPDISPRSDKALTLESSWLDRVNAYNAAYAKKSYRERTPVK